MTNDLRAAIRTAIQAAVTVIIGFGVAATGWINGENPDLVDDIDTAWKALIVIAIGLGAAVVTFVGNKIQEKLGVGQTPAYIPAKEAAGGDDA